MKYIIGILSLLLIIAMVRIYAPRNYGGGDGSFTQLDTSTAAATSTATGQPTLILARNYARSSAEICSPSANATTTFLFFQNFASPTAAVVGGVAVNKGYALAGGQCYQIRGSNLYISDVWASSTLAGQLITTIEK